MTTLPEPGDREPGFKYDPATDGRYHRWWSGTAWGDATRPVGGPTLADVAAGADAGDGAAWRGLASITRRALVAVATGVVVALVGVRMLVPGEYGFVEPSQIVAGWVTLVVGALVVQAGLVGFVVGGFGRASRHDGESAAAVGPDDPGATTA